jgi:hypothetical protein
VTPQNPNPSPLLYILIWIGTAARKQPALTISRIISFVFFFLVQPYVGPDPPTHDILVTYLLCWEEEKEIIRRMKHEEY